MTTTVLLARHGQTESNVTGFYMGWSNEDINDVGHTQVESLASRLAWLPWGYLLPVVSPLNF